MMRIYWLLFFALLPAAAFAGKVDFVAHYESGSAWESKPEVKAMVERVFADFEKSLETSGAWDAVIDVYLSDDNKDYANAMVGSWEKCKLGKEQVKVSTAWMKIVKGGKDPNGAIRTDGKGADIIVNLNLMRQGIEKNDGLLRHELMHGLGAVSFIPWPTMSPQNKLIRPKEGEYIEASLFDKLLFDADGNSVLGKYSSGKKKFKLNKYSTSKTQAEWKKGNAGVFFRGLDLSGKPVDMLLGTGPLGPNAALRMHEVNKVMYASYRKGEWDEINDFDKCFLRALKFSVSGDLEAAKEVRLKQVLNLEREWRNSRGQRFIAKLLSFVDDSRKLQLIQDGMIKMDVNGTVRTVPLNRLSRNDQKLIKGLLE